MTPQRFRAIAVQYPHHHDLQELVTEIGRLSNVIAAAETEVARLQGLVDAEPAPPAEARRRCDCPVPWEVADGGFGRGGQVSWLYARGIRAIICECGVTVSLDAPPAPDAATLADWAEWRRLDAMVSYWKEKRDCPHIGDSHFQLREGNRRAFQGERDRHQRPPDAAPATDATGGEGTCPE
jgi:hypothetical protein